MGKKIIVLAHTNTGGENTSIKHEERSEGMHEILSRKQGFAERWALFVFLTILVLLLGAAWFIKYPDIIETRANLTAANAPKEIVIRQQGRLVKLLKHNDEKVNAGEVFGWIESTSDHAEMIRLSSIIDSCSVLLQSGNSIKASQLFDEHYSKLGEVQKEYQQFIAAWQIFNDYVINGFYERKKSMLHADIKALESRMQTIEAQLALTQKDVALAQETFRMNEKLAEQNVLSKEEFRAEQSKFVNKQMAIPQLRASLLSAESEKRSKEKDLDQLSHDFSQQQINFQQSLQSLKSVVDEWKKNYLLQSPINGKMFFTMPVQENQYLPQSKLLGYINPNDTRFYAEANLPQANFGKIDTGLKVQLRFDAYPYQEVGFVDGTLQYVSKVASDSGFLATIRLDSGLITNTHHPILYKSGLKAQAIIITKNMRLLERLYYKLIKNTSVGK